MPTESRTIRGFNVRVEWQAGPGVHQTKDFAHHFQGVSRVAPPMARIERIFGGGAHRHSSAEHHNGSRFCQGIFHDKPTANTKENNKSQDNEARSNGGEDDRAALPLPDGRRGVLRSNHQRASACYPGTALTHSPATGEIRTT